MVAVGAKDMTVRIYALHKFSNLSVCCLGGMTDPAVATFFESNSLDCYSLSLGGQLAVWESSVDLDDLELVVDGGKVQKERKEGEEDDIGDVEEGAGDKSETITAEDTTGANTRAVYKRSAKHFLRDHLEGEGGGG